jgi:hypothetical protein
MSEVPSPHASSPFALLEHAFALLTCEPNPLSVPGAEIGHGLPERAIPLGELRAQLLHPSCQYPTRDAAVGWMLTRAKADGGVWTVGLAGMLLPGLRRAATPLKRACPGKAVDVEAEMLAGLVAAIATLAPERPRPATRLVWKARHSAEHLIRAELAERARPGHDPVSAEPPRPFGHPDLVLARAVRAGVISADDAELIGATRLGELTLDEAACAWGCSYTAAKLRRLRAEAALVPWVIEGIREGFEPEPPPRPGSEGVGRPRQGRRPDRRPGCATPPPPPTTARR